MPHTTPPNLEGLVRLSRREGVDIRPPLLRVLTDLYVQEKNHTREEEQQYAELALRLLPDVDVPTRIAVATKLAAYPLAPAAVMERLAADVPQVAEAALAVTSVEIPFAQESNAAPTDMPGRRGLPGVSAQGIGTPALAPPTSAYGVGTAETAIGELFLQAEARARREMIDQLEESLPAIAARAPVAANDVTEQLEKFALAREPQEFARVLQRALHIPLQIAQRIVDDRSGEPVLVAAKALGVPAAVLHRILLFLNPVVGESVERVFALSRLYEDLLPHVAQRLAADWRETARRRATARYIGVHADEASGSASGLMDNARRAVSGRDTARRETATPREWRQRTT